MLKKTRAYSFFLLPLPLTFPAPFLLRAFQCKQLQAQCAKGKKRNVHTKGNVQRIFFSHGHLISQYNMAWELGTFHTLSHTG